jgi:hypothetical protein
VREAQHHAHIPLFVVEYTGWAGADAVRQKLVQCPKIAGVLVIGSGVFVSRTGFVRRGEDDMGRAVRAVALSALSKDTNGAPHVANV